MWVRVKKLKPGDITVKGYVVKSIEPYKDGMVKITYTEKILGWDRDWEFAGINAWIYIKEVKT